MSSVGSTHLLSRVRRKWKHRLIESQAVDSESDELCERDRLRSSVPTGVSCASLSTQRSRRYNDLKRRSRFLPQEAHHPMTIYTTGQIPGYRPVPCQRHTKNSSTEWESKRHVTHYLTTMDSRLKKQGTMQRRRIVSQFEPRRWVSCNSFQCFPSNAMD